MERFSETQFETFFPDRYLISTDRNEIIVKKLSTFFKDRTFTIPAQVQKYLDVINKFYYKTEVTIVEMRLLIEGLKQGEIDEKIFFPIITNPPDKSQFIDQIVAISNFKKTFEKVLENYLVELPVEEMCMIQDLISNLKIISDLAGIFLYKPDSQPTIEGQVILLDPENNLNDTENLLTDEFIEVVLELFQDGVEDKYVNIMLDHENGIVEGVSISVVGTILDDEGKLQTNLFKTHCQPPRKKGIDQ